MRLAFCEKVWLPFLCSNKYDYDHFYDTSELYRRWVGAMNLSSNEIRCCCLQHFLAVILLSLSSLHVFALKCVLWQETGCGRDVVVKQNLPCLSLSHSAMYLNSETFQQQQKYHSKRILHSLREIMFETQNNSSKPPGFTIPWLEVSFIPVLQVFLFDALEPCSPRQCSLIRFWKASSSLNGKGL